MINLLDAITTYLAQKMLLVPGTNIFYNQLPADPATCILVQEIYNPDEVHPQINMEQHFIHISARADTNSIALNNAALCYRWLLTDDASYTAETCATVETTGFIELATNLTVKCQLRGTPIWLKTDDKGRKHFGFTAEILSKRLI